MRMLRKSFNSLSNFWFWHSLIRYFNQEFILFYFPCTFLKVKYISLDSNCIVIVTKFLHVRVVISSPQLLWIPKYSSTGFWPNLSVKLKIQPFWSKKFTALIVDFRGIYIPCLQIDKHFRSSILSEITWSVLSNFFFFHILVHFH